MLSFITFGLTGNIAISVAQAKCLRRCKFFREWTQYCTDDLILCVVEFMVYIHLDSDKNELTVLQLVLCHYCACQLEKRLSCINQPVDVIISTRLGTKYY